MADKEQHPEKTLSEDQEEHSTKQVQQSSGKKQHNVQSSVPKPRPKMEEQPSVVLPRPVPHGRPAEIKKRAQPSVPPPAPPPRGPSVETKKNVNPSIPPRGDFSSREKSVTEPLTPEGLTSNEHPTQRVSEVPKSNTAEDSIKKKDPTPVLSEKTTPTTAEHFPLKNPQTVTESNVTKPITEQKTEENPSVVLSRPVPHGRPAEIKKRAQPSVPPPAPPPRGPSVQTKKNVNPSIPPRGDFSSRKTSVMEPLTPEGSTSTEHPTQRESEVPRPTTDEDSIKKKYPTSELSEKTTPTIAEHFPLKNPQTVTESNVTKPITEPTTEEKTLNTVRQSRVKTSLQTTVPIPSKKGGQFHTITTGQSTKSKQHQTSRQLVVPTTTTADDTTMTNDATPIVSEITKPTTPEYFPVNKPQTPTESNVTKPIPEQKNEEKYLTTAKPKKSTLKPTIPAPRNSNVKEPLTPGQSTKTKHHLTRELDVPTNTKTEDSTTKNDSTSIVSEIRSTTPEHLPVNKPLTPTESKVTKCIPGQKADENSSATVGPSGGKRANKKPARPVPKKSSAMEPLTPERSTTTKHHVTPIESNVPKSTITKDSTMKNDPTPEVPEITKPTTIEHLPMNKPQTSTESNLTEPMPKHKTEEHPLTSVRPSVANRSNLKPTIPVPAPRKLSVMEPSTPGRSTTTEESKEVPTQSLDSEKNQVSTCSKEESQENYCSIHLDQTSLGLSSGPLKTPLSTVRPPGAKPTLKSNIPVPIKKKVPFETVCLPTVSDSSQSSGDTIQSKTSEGKKIVSSPSLGSTNDSCDIEDGDFSSKEVLTQSLDNEQNQVSTCSKEESQENYCSIHLGRTSLGLSSGALETPLTIARPPEAMPTLKTTIPDPSKKAGPSKLVSYSASSSSACSTVSDSSQSSEDTKQSKLSEGKRMVISPSSGSTNDSRDLEDIRRLLSDIDSNQSVSSNLSTEVPAESSSISSNGDLNKKSGGQIINFNSDCTPYSSTIMSSTTQSSISSLPWGELTSSSEMSVLTLNESVQVILPPREISSQLSSVNPFFPFNTTTTTNDERNTPGVQSLPNIDKFKTPTVEKKITPVVRDEKMTSVSNNEEIIPPVLEEETRRPLSADSDTTVESYVLACDRSNPSGESIYSARSKETTSVTNENNVRLEDIPPPTHDNYVQSRKIPSHLDGHVPDEIPGPSRSVKGGEIFSLNEDENCFDKEEEDKLLQYYSTMDIPVGLPPMNQHSETTPNEDSQPHLEPPNENKSIEKASRREDELQLSRIPVGISVESPSEHQSCEAKANEDSQPHSEFLIGDQVGSSKQVLHKIEDKDGKETPEEHEMRKVLESREAEKRKVAAEKARQRREAQAHPGGEGEPALERRQEEGDKGTPSKKVTQRPIQTMSLQDARFRQNTPEGDNLASEERKINQSYYAVSKNFENTIVIEPLSKKNPFDKMASAIKEKLAGELQDQILALNILRGLVLEISFEPKVPLYEDKIVKLLKEVFQQIESFLSQGSPELTAEACVTVAWLSKELRLKLAEVETLQTVVTTLLHKATMDSEVEYMAKATLRYIFKYIHEPQLFDHLVHQLEEASDTNHKLYFTVAVLFLTVMEYWTPQELSPALDSMEKAFLTMFNTDVQCQAPLLLTYWQLNWDNHPRANVIWNKLTDDGRRKIENGRFIPTPQRSQAELLPKIRRTRSKNLNIEPEEVSEVKKSKSMLTNLMSKIKLTSGRSEKGSKATLPEEKKVLEPIAGTSSGRKRKTKDIKKRRRHHSPSSDDSISEVSVSLSSNSDDSSYSDVGKKHKKNWKETLALKALKKMKKQKKQVEKKLETDLSDTSKDEEKPVSFLITLKRVPTSMLNLLTKSKKSTPTETELKIRKEKKQMAARRAQATATSIAEVPEDVEEAVLPEDISGFPAYQEMVEELRYRDERLAQPEEVPVGSGSEPQSARQTAEEPTGTTANAGASKTVTKDSGTVPESVW